MRLGEYLDMDFVLPELTSTDKVEVLRELVLPIGEKIAGFDTDKAVQVLLERESLGTTGIGDGIAIPHGKLEDLEKIVVAVGRSSSGVEFEALDNSPCHIFFLVFAPEQVAGLHLRVLAHISKLLKEDGFRKGFLSAEDKDSLWNVLQGT